MPEGSIENYRLEWLTSFLAVVDHGGFAAAAENTYRSQPRISAHVAELERHLGALLFDRRERPVRLTEAGIAFLEHARRVLSDLEAGTSSVQAVLGLLRGRVRLGWHPSAGAAFGPQLLRTFLDLHPGVSVTLFEGATLELSTALHTGEADIAIRPLLPAPRESSIQHHLLWEEPLVAVVPESHPLAGLEYVGLAEVADHPIVTIGGDPDGNPHEIHRALAAARLSPSIAYRTNEPQTLVALAREGLGIGLTNLLAAAVSDTTGVNIIPLSNAGNRRQVGVFWDSGRPLQPAGRALIDLIAQLPVPAAVQQYQRRA
jgi:DNA-binding transcriptional LysR family regulator